MEATQDQVMVCVVPCVPVYAQDVVGPGSHLLASASHAPRPTVLQPCIVLWEKVPSQIFQARRGYV